jgi:hypothetical protein
MKTEKDHLKLLSKEELHFLANYLRINSNSDKFTESSATEIAEWTAHHHKAFKEAYQKLQFHASKFNIKLDAFIEAGIILSKATNSTNSIISNFINPYY